MSNNHSYAQDSTLYAALTLKLALLCSHIAQEHFSQSINVFLKSMPGGWERTHHGRQQVQQIPGKCTRHRGGVRQAYVLVWLIASKVDTRGEVGNVCGHCMGMNLRWNIMLDYCLMYCQDACTAAHGCLTAALYLHIYIGSCRSYSSEQVNKHQGHHDNDWLVSTGWQHI